MCFTEKASSSSKKTTIITTTYQVGVEEISEKNLQFKALESGGKHHKEKGNQNVQKTPPLSEDSVSNPTHRARQFLYILSSTCT